MPLGSEAGSVQRPFVRYAVAAGWTYLSPEQALALRTGGVTSPVLDGVLVGQLQKLNPGIVDAARAAEVVKRLVRVRPTIEGNLDAWEFLRGLKTVFVEAEKRERNVRLLDLDQPTANVFHVTDEFTFSNGTPPDLRADIVFFINGVPVLIVETKRATARDGIAQALDDLRYYHERGPELLALLQLHALTHLVRFYYGATWNLSGKALFNWREEVAESEAERLWSAPAERSGDGAFPSGQAVLPIRAGVVVLTRSDPPKGQSGGALRLPPPSKCSGSCVGIASASRLARVFVVSGWHGFEEFPTGQLQAVELVLHDVPEDCQVDPEIVVNEDVSEGDDLAPVGFRAGLTERLGDAASRFSNDLQVPDDGVHGLFVGLEGSEIHRPDVAPNPPDGIEDVVQVKAVVSRHRRFRRAHGA
jgi:hypothetical protein